MVWDTRIVCLANLMGEISANEGVAFTVDLEAKTVSTPGGTVVNFEIDPVRKHNLLEGLDDIGITLTQVDKIDAFEAAQKQSMPWLWRNA